MHNKCLYSECGKCRERVDFIYTEIDKKNSQEIISYFEWQNVKENPSTFVTTNVVKKVDINTRNKI